ncbi:hypothetical protein [Bradyrhizobium sp. AZCC 2289]|uniref:hypothetical protein n=1 Tax=Bradyrhizobium sp. AZCC 2289 TaxID=3117026 RepID=UPI002FF43522
MADLFGSPKRTLARARHHIADLRSKADDFMNGRAPGTYQIERRTDGKNQHTIKFDRGFFEQLSNIAFDAANNLRSALDQTAFGTAILAGKEQAKRALFPIAGSLPDLDNLIKKNCRDLRPEIIDLFKTFKPYGGGNIWLSALSKLCNTQKHAALIPFKTDNHQVMYVMNGIIIGLGHRWHPKTFELEILGSGGADFTRGGGYFAFGLSFTHDDQVIAGSEPAGLLDGAAIQVDRVIKATELECQRLGLIPGEGTG